MDNQVKKIDLELYSQELCARRERAERRDRIQRMAAKIIFRSAVTLLLIAAIITLVREFGWINVAIGVIGVIGLGCIITLAWVITTDDKEIEADQSGDANINKEDQNA